jgi:hypothetical protein
VTDQSFVLVCLPNVQSELEQRKLSRRMDRLLTSLSKLRIWALSLKSTLLHSSSQTEHWLFPTSKPWHCEMGSSYRQGTAVQAIESGSIAIARPEGKAIRIQRKRDV